MNKEASVVSYQTSANWFFPSLTPCAGIAGWLDSIDGMQREGCDLLRHSLLCKHSKLHYHLEKVSPTG